jgi:hypothetical protein
MHSLYHCSQYLVTNFSALSAIISHMDRKEHLCVLHFWWRTTYEPRLGGTHYTIVPNTSLQFFQLFNYYFLNAFQLQLYSSDGNNYMLKDDVIGHNTSS